MKASLLEARIKRLIAMDGPMSVAEYMHICMSDPKAGYYATQNPLGKSGDFLTAPEISQMFGELIGVWAIKAWETLDKPERFNLVELGPGRGTLMSDLLRAVKIAPEFSSAAQVQMIEASKQLSEQQQAKLASHDNITWHSEIS